MRVLPRFGPVAVDELEDGPSSAAARLGAK